LYAAPAECGLDIVDLNDGRVFERYTQPQMHGEIIAGRVWSFRDVTSRILVEMELRAANEQMAAALEQLKAIEGSLIDQNRQLEAQKRILTESEERFRFFMDHLPGTVWAVDSSLRFILSRGSGLSALGLDPDETVGKTLAAFFETEDPNHPAIVAHCRALSGEPVEYEYNHNGLFFKTYLSPVHDATGCITGVAGIAVDITDNRRNNDELLRKNEELSQMTEELMASEEELRQNIEELGAKERMIIGSEEKFRKAFHACPAPIIISRLSDGRYADVNEQFLTAIGYTRDEVIDHTSRELDIFVDYADRDAIINRLRETHRIRNTECRMRRKNNEEIIAIINAEIIELNDEDHILFIINDVTAVRRSQDELIRKNDELSQMTEELMSSEEELRQNIEEITASEQRLRESELKYRLIAENTADNIYIFDMDLNLQYISPSVKTMRGFTAEEALDLPLEKTMTLASLENVHALFQEEMAREAAGTADPKRHVSFETEEYCKDGSTILVENTVTLIRNSQGVPTGILGISRDITRRRQTERTLLESESLLRTLVENIQDPIVIVNFSGIVLFANRAAERLVGLTDFHGSMPLKMDQFLDPMSRERALLDLATIARDGGPLISEYAIQTLNKEQCWVEAVGIRICYKGEDVDLVTLRDITERVRAQTALSEANRKLNLLTGITRHDVINKLAVLSGSIGILKRQITDPDLAGWLKTADESAISIRRQIEFTRKYENLGAGSPLWQDLEQVIRRLPTILIPVEIQFTGIEIYADPMLELVFSNLLDNTQRHGEHVERIRISCAEREEGLVISWEDDGIGISDDTKERIFEKGFGKNTGLGLYLVREILDITSISIKETGEAGRGARFEILVPKGQYRH
jgi:PAS domain S-box-containing protein